MLLHFPTEPLRFRELRTRAFERFRWRYRVAVVRQFGLEAEDLGAYITWCERCEQVGSTVTGFEHLDGDLTLTALEEEVRTRADDPRNGWRPPRCVHCNAPEPTPVVAFFGRYLPESRTDLHLEMVFGGDRVVRVEHHRMSRRGESEQVARPGDALQFMETFGAPLSVRTLWRDFIQRNVYADEIVCQPVHPGYCLALRPFTDDPHRAARMYEGFDGVMEGLREARAYDVVAFLREREEDDIPVDFSESYHAWLGGYAHEISEALIDPMVIADSETFVATLASQAAIYRLGVSRAGDDQNLFVRIGRGELRLNLNLGPIFFRIQHEGLSFHRGLRRHFRRELRALSQASDLPAMLRARLPGRLVRVGEGGALEIRDRQGTATFKGDLVGVATAFDVRTESGLDALLRRVSSGVA